MSDSVERPKKKEEVKYTGRGKKKTCSQYEKKIFSARVITFIYDSFLQLTLVSFSFGSFLFFFFKEFVFPRLQMDE